MATEESPLLAEVGEAVDIDVRKHEEVYNRFSPARKRFIVALISLAGLMPLFVSGSFIPSIPQIARDLETTGSVVNLAVSLSIMTAAVGSLLWATYSGFYGRRPVYLVSIAFQCVGSVGVGSAASIPQLLGWRVVQAFGASSGLSVGIGVIGDIYKLEQRGTASGVFFAAVLLGPAMAPLVGGIMAHYYSWRTMQFALAAFGTVNFALISLFQPETSQPGARGVDKMIANEGAARWVWLNPFRCLGLLRSPNIMFLALAGAFVLVTDYAILVPIAFTVGAKYNITNEAIIGALCIPIGVGNFVGAPLAGALSDRMVVKWRKLRGNKWVPEDRLRACIPGALFLVPGSMLGFGLALRFVDGTPGLVLCLLCFLMNGLGVDFVLSPSGAYYVDILHDKSAEVTAASMGFRSLLLSTVVMLLLPSINTIGATATYMAATVVAFMSYVLLWVIIRYGDRLRAWVDVGFSTLKDN